MSTVREPSESGLAYPNNYPFIAGHLGSSHFSPSPRMLCETPVKTLHIVFVLFCRLDSYSQLELPGVLQV